MIASRACRARSAALASMLAVSCALPAAAVGFQVLTSGKLARFDNRGDPALNGGVVVVGRDRALRTLHDPTCPATSTVEVEAYLQSTFRDAILAHVELDCAKWSRAGNGFRYSDPNGTVRSIYYAHMGLRIDIRGPGFAPSSAISSSVHRRLSGLPLGRPSRRRRRPTRATE